MTVLAVAVSVVLVVGTIRVAAAWTAAAAPVTISPASASELEARLADEQERSTALMRRLEGLDARSRDLTAALEEAQRRIATDATNAADLHGQLVTAKDRLAKVEAALARARRALRTTTATGVSLASVGRTSSHEEEDEGEEHGD